MKGVVTMTKCTPIVLYKASTLQIYNITVIKSNGDKVCLLTYENEDKACIPYRYNRMCELISDVLQILKNNNFYTTSHNEFNSTLWNINFIDIDNPFHVFQYYKNNEGVGL